MDDLALDDIIPNLDENARNVILNLTLSWARYDGILSQWLIYAYGMSLDDGALFVGSMDTKTKIDRLKCIYQHHGKNEAVTSLNRLLTAHLDKRWIRNHLAHSPCVGRLKNEPETVVFATLKASKGNPGKMAVQTITLDDMRKAEAFARTVADTLNAFLAKLKSPPSTQPPEPPEFL